MRQRTRGVASSGHSIASLAAASHCSKLSAYAERQSGLSGLTELRQRYPLAETDDPKTKQRIAQQLAGDLAKVHAKVFAPHLAPQGQEQGQGKGQMNPMRLAILGDAPALKALESACTKEQALWLPRASADLHWPQQLHLANAPSLGLGAPSAASMTPKHLAWEIESQVHYCAASCPSLPLTDPQAPALAIGAKVIANQLLHPKIRESGGAYGSGCSHSASNAELIWFSYRDPQHQQTLRTFFDSLSWLRQKKLTAEVMPRSPVCLAVWI